MAARSGWSGRWDYDPRLHPVIRCMSCGSCSHQFTWGYHTDEALDVLFGRAQSSQTAENMTGADIEAARNVWAKVVDAVSPHCASGRWLDVGAGSGMLAGVACALSPDPAICDQRIPRLAITESRVELTPGSSSGKVSGASFLSSLRAQSRPSRARGAHASAMTAP